MPHRVFARFDAFLRPLGDLPPTVFRFLASRSAVPVRNLRSAVFPRPRLIAHERWTVFNKSTSSQGRRGQGALADCYKQSGLRHNTLSSLAVS